MGKKVNLKKETIIKSSSYPSRNFDTHKTTTVPKEPSLDGIQVMTNAKLIVPDSINDRIIHTCRMINEVEWSGVLFYSIQGSVADPENFICTIEDFYLMDIGSTAHTQFKYDDIAEAYATHDEWIDNGYRVGLLH
jgi:hypothetical protein